MSVLLELGAYVGYTTTRLACHSGRQQCASLAVSLELDPIHVLMARHLLDVAKLSQQAEVWVGLSYDTQARLPETFGSTSISFTFMDHRGTQFHNDLMVLEKIKQQCSSAVYVADNVLKPGAPLFLWHFPQSLSHTTELFSMLEFLHTDAEDWMLIGHSHNTGSEVCLATA